jgi:hypothetical protein
MRIPSACGAPKRFNEKIVIRVFPRKLACKFFAEPLTYAQNPCPGVT